MQLRHDKGDHLGPTRRFVAWAYSWHLDEQLAAGVDPASDPTDGASPLWARTDRRDLQNAVDSALTGLGA